MMKKSILFLFLSVFLILSSCSSDSRDEAVATWYYPTKHETIKNGSIYKTTYYNKGESCGEEPRFHIESDTTINGIGSYLKYNYQTDKYDCVNHVWTWKYNSTDKTIERGLLVTEYYKIEGKHFIIYSDKFQDGIGNEYEEITYYEAK